MKQLHECLVMVHWGRMGGATRRIAPLCAIEPLRGGLSMLLGVISCWVTAPTRADVIVRSVSNGDVPKEVHPFVPLLVPK